MEILFWRLLGFRVSPKAKKEGKIIEKRERGEFFKVLLSTEEKETRESRER